MSSVPERSNTVEIITPDQYSDRRSEPRFACDDHGAMLFLATHEVVPCRILDQSASGARVSFGAMGDLTTEIWLIDLVQNSVRCGTSAWSMPNRMGLKFSLVLALKPGQPRPAKVPQPVYDAWLKLTGAAPETPADTPPQTPDDDVLYFD